MQTQTKFYADVTAPVTHWEETTDAIMWTIEQNPVYQLQSADIILENAPIVSRSGAAFYLATLEEQTAKLTGYTPEPERKKTIYQITAKLIDIQIPDPADPEHPFEEYGYLITVSQYENWHYHEIEQFRIRGDSRKYFERMA